jgi:hypothetical protein
MNERAKIVVTVLLLIVIPRVLRLVPFISEGVSYFLGIFTACTVLYWLPPRDTSIFTRWLIFSLLAATLGGVVMSYVHL